jgi:hypothetical protein
VPLLSPEPNSDVIRDVNRGNFLQLLDFRAQAGDTSIHTHVNQKAKYTSPVIQNELLGLVSTHQVVKDIKLSKYFTIIADETRDVSNIEQICLAIRFFHFNTSQSEEKFISFIPATSLTGKLQ